MILNFTFGRYILALRHVQHVIQKQLIINIYYTKVREKRYIFMKRPKYWGPFVPYGCVNCGSKKGSIKKSSSLNGRAIKRGPKISTAIKLEGGGGGGWALMARPLREELFLRLPLGKIHIKKCFFKWSDH